MHSEAAHLRSTADDDAAHSVGEAVGVQAGNVIVHDLHLTALEIAHLIQTDFVLLGVLGAEESMFWQKNSTKNLKKPT